MLQHHQDLDHPGNSRRRFQVADVGFHGTHLAIADRLGRGAEGLGKGLHLDRVAQGSPRAMGLHIGHRGRIHLGIGVGRLQQLGLSSHAGGCDGLAHRRMVHRTAPNHPKNSSILGDRPFQGLKQQHPTALAGHIAIGLSIKRAALTRWTQHPCSGK